MRIFFAVQCLALGLMQYRLWLSEQGLREVARLQSAVDTQSAANHEQAARNRQLQAEVADLKVGLTALEERARSELGMVGNSETFYQIVTTTTPPAAAPATAAPKLKSSKLIPLAKSLWALSKLPVWGST